MKKIVIVSPSLKIGGIERALTVLANEWVKRNHEVYFIPCLPGEAHYSLDSRVNVVLPAIPYNGGAVSKVAFYSRLVFFLRKKVRSLRPHVVLSFGDVFNPLVLLALWKTGNRTFISDRTSPKFRLNPVANFLKSALYPSCAGFIAQSQRMFDFQTRRFGNKLNIKVIPNAIDLIQDGAATQEEKSVLYVGRLSWEKGVDRLISAFAQIPQRDWTLDLVGSGPAEKELRSLASSLGCADRVTFHGNVKMPAKHYLAAAVFVLPSHVEGFPNALCEAMSAGLPVVCFESIPYEGIVTHGESGFVVKKDDITDLTSILESLINDPEKRLSMGTNARSSVQRFRSDSIAEQYLSFMGVAE